MIEVIDLFSGAGGLTFWLSEYNKNNNFVFRNDFNIRFANEFNRDAAEAFRLNYPEITMIEDDIANIDESFLKSIGISSKGVDLVIGGPPCQSFSTVGKRQYDKRAKMYREYRRILSFIQPKMFVLKMFMAF